MQHKIIKPITNKTTKFSFNPFRVPSSWLDTLACAHPSNDAANAVPIAPEYDCAVI